MEISVVCEKEEVSRAVRESCRNAHVYKSVLPYVFRAEYEDLLKKALCEDEVVVRTMDELGFLKQNSYKGRMIADTYLYAMNKASAEVLNDLGIYRDTAPLELTFHELKEMDLGNSELTVYGRVPMMVTAQCLYRNTHDDKCKKDVKNGHSLYLKDRMGKDLPCVSYCSYCTNVIYNSIPMSLHGRMKEIRELKPAALRLHFTTEGPKEAAEITDYYLSLVSGKKTADDCPVREYTNGHFRDGVE